MEQQNTILIYIHFLKDFQVQLSMFSLILLFFDFTEFLWWNVYIQQLDEEDCFLHTSHIARLYVFSYF